MNNPLNTSNGAGLLKNAYKGQGPVAQMNNAHPMIGAIRKRRDIVSQTQTMGL